MNLLSFVMTVLRGAGDSRTPFFFMALAVVLDIVLNPLLIRGIGPFPELGIAGSATSTLIGQTVSVMAILVRALRAQASARLAGADLALLRPDPTLAAHRRLQGRSDGPADDRRSRSAALIA